MALDPSVQTVYVSKQRIRQLFNEGQYFERARRGEFRPFILADHFADPIKSGQPRGTKTQMVAYVDANGEQIALVHQYVLPSGALGGSGLPDPKKLRQGDILYLIDPEDRAP